MDVHVLLFAQLADAIGSRSLTVSVPEHACVDDVVNELAEAHEPVRAIRDTLAVALDERYVNGNTPVTPGCTIALIPPVSGG